MKSDLNLIFSWVDAPLVYIILLILPPQVAVDCYLLLQVQ